MHSSILRLTRKAHAHITANRILRSSHPKRRIVPIVVGWFPVLYHFFTMVESLSARWIFRETLTLLVVLWNASKQQTTTTATTTTNKEGVGDLHQNFASLSSQSAAAVAAASFNERANHCIHQVRRGLAVVARWGISMKVGGQNFMSAYEHLTEFKIWVMFYVREKL